jgi:ATP-binding cassette subfamily B protein
MKRFRHLAQGRTSIIITHRFTTAMRADLIHVMDQGTIVETGTHEALLAQGGLYAESWTAQMETSRSPKAPDNQDLHEIMPPLSRLAEGTKQFVEE